MALTEMEAQIVAAVGRAYPGYTGATLFEVGETLRGSPVWLVLGDWLLDEEHVFIPEHSPNFEPWPRSKYQRRPWRVSTPPWRVRPPEKAPATLAPSPTGPALRVTLGELLRARR